jgi:nitrile hydratase accessory protein
LNRFEQHRDVIGLARSTMPPRCDGEPLFREPWHARIFAVMVALVKGEKLEWIEFQERLTKDLKEHQSADVKLTSEEVDLQYFDCWLRAAEETLATSGFVDEQEVAHQIEAITASIDEIRQSQIAHNH